jgi:hypothetical protein
MSRCGTWSRSAIRRVCTIEALERFASPLFAIGVRLEQDGRLHIEAPFGLSDLFALRLWPNPWRRITAFTRIATDVRGRWPELIVDTCA